MFTNEKIKIAMAAFKQMSPNQNEIDMNQLDIIMGKLGIKDPFICHQVFIAFDTDNSHTVIQLPAPPHHSFTPSLRHSSTLFISLPDHSPTSFTLPHLIALSPLCLFSLSVPSISSVTSLSRLCLLSVATTPMLCASR